MAQKWPFKFRYGTQLAPFSKEMLQFIYKIAFVSVIAIHFNSPRLFAEEELSEKQLLLLAKQLAPRVNLFNEIWKLDPQAELYAGTTRDFLYWILRHSRNPKNGTSLNARIEKLSRIQVIDIRDVIGPESDVDLISKKLKEIPLDAAQFGIRKFDILDPSRLDPTNDWGRDEFDQGFIAIEKMRLSQNGIQTDSRFGNGASEILSGRLSVNFSSSEIFWKTHYARLYSNHPALLALRFVRLVAQDYYNRYGERYPSNERLWAAMSTETKKALKLIFSEARTDEKFSKFIRNPQGQKWWNAVYRKSFRSYTNPTATKLLMDELGVTALAGVFPTEIQSANEILFRKNWNAQAADERIRSLGFDPARVFIDINERLSGRKLFHGTNSMNSYSNILFQGILASFKGAAGEGVYGVAYAHREYAVEWAKDKGDSRLVVELELDASTRLLDITQSPGKELFEAWASQNSQKSQMHSYDDFADSLAIDILRYHYEPEAFVLKNSAVIVGREGYELKLKSLGEIIESARHIKSVEEIPNLLDSLLLNAKNLDEQELVLRSIPSDAFANDNFNFDSLRLKLKSLWLLYGSRALNLIRFTFERFKTDGRLSEAQWSSIKSIFEEDFFSAIKKNNYWGNRLESENLKFLLSQLKPETRRRLLERELRENFKGSMPRFRFYKVPMRDFESMLIHLAEHEGAMISEDIHHFDIPKEEDRIKIAKAAAAQDGAATLKNIKAYRITNKEALYQISFIAAASSGTMIADSYRFLNTFEDSQKFRIMKRALESQISDDSLPGFLEKLPLKDEAKRFALAMTAANEEPEPTAISFRSFKMKDQKRRFAIAYRMALTCPTCVAADISEFELSEEQKRKVAIRAAKGGTQFIAYLDEFRFEDPKLILKLLKMAAKSEEATDLDGFMKFAIEGWRENKLDRSPSYRILKSNKLLGCEESLKEIKLNKPQR